MRVKLKSIDQQVMVITGASSGIGLVTAKAAARSGASVVLAARNDDDLDRAVREIRAEGGRAVFSVADVASLHDVEQIAETALREFGRIDTWVNNAAVSIYGRVMEVSLEDMRRQFEVMYWGAVYGCRTAVMHMAERGGALINIGSVLSDRAIPLQATYCAAKHAMRAFTDSLRMELEKDRIPISVTLIKPASIDTPFYEKAKSLMGVEPRPIPPVYAPEVVADAIIQAAERPVRELIAGGAGVGIRAAGMLAPRATDKVMERTMFDSQRTEQPLGDRPDNLYQPVAYDGGERGKNWKGRVHPTSAYTTAALHPRKTALAIAGVVGLAAGAWALWARNDEEKRRRVRRPRPRSPLAPRAD